MSSAPVKGAGDRDTVLEHLVHAVAGLDRDGAVAALHLADAAHWSSLARLAGYLGTHADALQHPAAADAPLPLARLAHVLHTAGHREVVAPRCADCGRLTARLPNPGPRGRICGTCQTRQHHAECARCGRRARVVARRPDGGICGACYRREPAHRQHCAQCGRLARPDRRLADGSALCTQCTPRPQRRCARCGHTARVARHDQDGPVCYACYRRPPRRCGRCDRVQPIGKRATDHSPDLCTSCWRGADAECATCGRVRACQRISTGAPVCASCRPAPRHRCYRCGQHRTAIANWPVGPVCGRCYQHVRAHPGHCARCQRTQPLIGHDENGHALCGPCAGIDVHYECVDCGSAGLLHSNHRCPRCVLGDRLADLLAGPGGTVSDQLQPLAHALSAVDQPNTILIWLTQSPAARMLARLAGDGTELTHAALDALAPSKALHYARDMLIAAGVLPARDEHLERLTGFVDHLLADAPATTARIIRPYAHWYVIHRARRRAAAAPTTKHAAAALRTTIRTATAILTALHEHQLTLADLTQHRLDEWLDQHRNQATAARPFIGWTNRHRLTADLQVPTRRRSQPHVFADDHDRAAQLRRCLDDDTMPIHLRVAGALVLLFGMSLSRLAHLHTDHVDVAGDTVALRIGEHRLQLPTRLAVLIRRLLDTPGPRSTLAKLTGPGGWLFPGASPTRPTSASRLHDGLHRYGVTVMAGRNSTRYALAAELPASVLADLTGIHISTAVSWNRLTQRDWTDYLAIRARDTSPSDTTTLPIPSAPSRVR